MADNSPRSPDRKLGLIAPLSIGAVFVLILLAILVLRDRRPAPEPKPQPPAVDLSPAVVGPPPPLTRTDVLRRANAIAAAFSAGTNAGSTGEAAMLGRKFVIRVPFGCEGPQLRPGAAQAFYEFDPKKQTVHLVARPAAWTSLPVIQGLADVSKIEAVEGFWLPHPWSFADTCPPPREAPVPPSPTPPAAQTLGLASIFESGGSRVQRRGERAYDQVIKLKDGEAPPLADGYRLVLEGRFAAYPDGRVAHCWSESPDHWPVCLFAVQYDRVAFESGQDGQLLAEWRE